MATERYIIGPFRFTFANGRLWAKYRRRSYGDSLAYSVKPMPADMTLAMDLHWFLQTGDTRRAALVDFVRWYMAGVPGAEHDAERLESVALAMPRYSFISPAPARPSDLPAAASGDHFPDTGAAAHGTH